MVRWILVVLVPVLAGVVLWPRSVDEALPAKRPPAPRGAPGAALPAELVELHLEAPPVTARTPASAKPESVVSADESESRPAPPATVRRLPVLLFEHADHDPQFANGARWQVFEGSADSGLAFGDDDVSRVEVPEGWKVTLYDGRAGEGAHIVLRPGGYNLSAYGFNDRVSSLRVTREETADDLRRGPANRVLLHERAVGDTEPGGLVWALPLERSRTTRLFRASEGRFTDNAPSAAWVPPGFELTLFDDASGRGAAMVLGPGFHDLSSLRWRNRVSAARVRRTEGD